MTSKFTREQLIEKLKHRIAITEKYPHLEEAQIDSQIFKIALAAMDSEPVAEVVSIYGDPEAFGEREIRPLVGIQQMPYGTKLYRHAQQPVVPDDVLDALQKVARIRLDLNDFDGDRRGIADCLGDAEEALIEIVNRRAAMLQELQKSAGASNNCRSNEKVQAVEVQSVPGIKPAPALGSLPKIGEVLPTNSPVIGIDPASGPGRTVEVRYVAPPGYVMVPKEPTKEMIDAGWLHYMATKNPSSKGTYKAMLAAAPQEEPDGK